MVGFGRCGFKPSVDSDQLTVLKHQCYTGIWQSNCGFILGQIWFGYCILFIVCYNMYMIHTQGVCRYVVRCMYHHTSELLAVPGLSDSTEPFVCGQTEELSQLGC